MGFPKRSMIKPVIPIQEPEKKPDVQIGFPVRNFVGDPKDNIRIDNKPKSEVVVDTGLIKDENIETTNKQSTPMINNSKEFTPYYNLDENGKYSEEIVEEFIINNEVAVINNDFDPEKVQDYKPSNNVVLPQKKERKQPPLKLDEKYKYLRETPLEELVFHIFNEDELKNLPLSLLTRILQSRNRTFKKKFGKDAFAFENIFEYGDKKEDIIRKILKSNPPTE